MADAKMKGERATSDTSYVGRVVATSRILIVERKNGFVKIKSKERATKTVAMVASAESARFFKLTQLIAMEPVHLLRGMTRKVVTSECSRTVPLVNIGKYTTLSSIQFAKPGSMVIVFLTDKVSLSAWVESALVVDFRLKVVVILSRSIRLADGRVVERMRVDVETLAGIPYFDALPDPLDTAGRPIPKSAFVEAFSKDGHKIYATHESYDPITQTSFLKLRPVPIGAHRLATVHTRHVTLIEGPERSACENGLKFIKEMETKIRDAQKLIDQSIASAEIFKETHEDHSEQQIADWFMSRVELVLEHTAFFEKYADNNSISLQTKFESDHMLELFTEKNICDMDSDLSCDLSSDTLDKIYNRYGELAQDRMDERLNELAAPIGNDDDPVASALQRQAERHEMERDMSFIINLLEKYAQRFRMKELEKSIKTPKVGQVISLLPDDLQQFVAIQQGSGDILFGSTVDPALLKPPLPCMVVGDHKLQKKLARREPIPKFKLLERELREELGATAVAMQWLAPNPNESRRWLFTTPQIKPPYEITQEIPAEYEVGKTVLVSEFADNRWFVLDIKQDFSGEIFARMQHKFYDMDFICALEKLKKCNKAAHEMRARDRNGKELSPRDLATHICLAPNKQRDLFVLCCDYGYCVTADVWSDTKVVYSTIKGTDLLLKEVDALRNVNFDCGQIPVDKTLEMDDVL